MTRQPELFDWEPPKGGTTMIVFPLARRTKTIRTVATTLAKRVTDEGKVSYWNKTVNGLRREMQRRGCAPAEIEAQVSSFRHAISEELARQQHGRQQA
jgi:hypothetical protein